MMMNSKVFPQELSMQSIYEKGLFLLKSRDEEVNSTGHPITNNFYHNHVNIPCASVQK
jgi:hypothetical protein